MTQTIGTSQPTTSASHGASAALEAFAAASPVMVVDWVTACLATSGTARADAFAASATAALPAFAADFAQTPQSSIDCTISGAKAYIEAIRLSPDSYSPPRGCFSELLGSKGKWDEALRETRAAVKSSPENLVLLYRLKRLLGRKQLWDEEQEVTEEINRLEELYHSR